MTKVEDNRTLLSLIDVLEQQLLDGSTGVFDTLGEMREILSPLEELDFNEGDMRDVFAEPVYFDWHNMAAGELEETDPSDDNDKW